jgi:hypothetical protein
MRKAFYYDSAMPPEYWLKMTSLLWDKIWISPLVASLLNSTDTFKELEDNFLTRLYVADKDIFDTEFPEVGKSRFQEVLKGDGVALFKRIVLEYVEEISKRDITPETVEANKKLIKQAHFEISRRNVTKAKQMIERLEERGRTFKKSLIEKAEYFNRAFYNSRFKELFPQLDYFFNKEQSFHEYYSSGKEVILIGVEAFLPVDLAALTIRQIKDFRNTAKTQRIRFRKEAEDVLKDFVLSVSEKDFHRTTERFKDILREELDVLKKAYRACKIEAVYKGMGIFAVSSVLSFLASVADIGIFQPASITAGISFSGSRGLASYEKDRAEILKSPWGYLLALKKMK